METHSSIGKRTEGAQDENYRFYDKVKVEWSRSDKEELDGQITYTNGHILISKR